MADYSANPNRPADPRALASPWHRLAMQRFLLLSLLVHGLALLLKFDFWPVSPVDRDQQEAPLGGSMLDAQESRSLRVHLQRASARPVVRAPPSADHLLAPRQNPASNADRSKAFPEQPRHTPPRTTTSMPEAKIKPAQPINAIGENAQTLIARGKAMLDTDSRRMMADPMAQTRFASPANAIKPTPLEQATATRAQSIENLDGKLIRVTTASGKRYCLQGLPEVATRDIPSPVLSVPSNCP